MSSVQLLIGPIASGKSTYARDRAQDGAVIVNDDDVCLAIHGGDYTLFDPRMRPLYKSVEIAIATTALAMGLDVVVDRAQMVTAEARRRWVGIAHAFGAVCEAVIFPMSTPETHVERRVKHDTRGLSAERWLRVAKDHLAAYQEPTAAEGFDRILHLNDIC